MPQFENLTGRKFNRFTVISRAPNRGAVTVWNCACECGEKRVVSAAKLKNGHSKSCGCWHRDAASAANTKHGFSRVAVRHPLYHIWSAMRGRCSNPNDNAFLHYGGRGIKVCARWNEFPAFLEDMGERPSLEHSLDRENVNGDYCPENCRWVTHQQQCENRRCSVRLFVNGLEVPAAEFEQEHDLRPGATKFMKRIMREKNITAAEAVVYLSCNNVRRKFIMFRGRRTWLARLAREQDIKYVTLYARVKRGMSVEEAVAAGKNSSRQTLLKAA